MFGFSTIVLGIIFVSSLSALSTLAIIASCVVAGRSSSAMDSAFRTHMLQMQAAGAAPTSPRTLNVPIAGHRKFNVPAGESQAGESQPESTQKDTTPAQSESTKSRRTTEKL